MKSWIALLILMCCAEGFSASIWTNAIGGSWSDGINWSGGAPTNNADTRITNATSKTVMIDAATPATNLNLSRLQIWGPANTTNSLLLMNAGLSNPLLIANSLTILRGGELVMTNSALTDSGTLIMSNGAVTLAGSAVSIAGSALTMSAGATMRL